MQLHLVKFQSFSQQSHTSQDAELPTFEEAFDTVSLKKFFQEHDSHLSTPFTTYSETPFYEELQSSVADNKGMFGSPLQNYINVPTFNLGSDLEDSFNGKIFELLDRKPFGFDEREDGMMKSRQQPRNGFLEERENEQMKIRQIMNDQSSLRINMNGGASSFVMLSNLKDELNLPEIHFEDSMRDIHLGDQINTRIDQDNKIKNKKRAVFIIERNAIPKAISKMPKEEKKAPSIVKRKKSAQLEKKEEEKNTLKKEKKEKGEKNNKTEKIEKVEKAGKMKVEKAEKEEKEEKGEKKEKSQKDSKKKSQTKNLVDLILQKKNKNSKEDIN